MSWSKYGDKKPKEYWRLYHREYDRKWRAKKKELFSDLRGDYKITDITPEGSMIRMTLLTREVNSNA